uniref:Major histocompatibility complex, class II, DM beta n=1 Tax=Loxodonta africana TaxID=9785 RepID=G3SUW7_LOXAF
FPEQSMTSLLPLLLGLSLSCTGAGKDLSFPAPVLRLEGSDTVKTPQAILTISSTLIPCVDNDENKLVKDGNANSLINYLTLEEERKEGSMKEWEKRKSKTGVNTNFSFSKGCVVVQTGPPSVKIAPVTPFNTREPVMLACYVWGFYPADVTITWRKNGQPIPPHGSAQKTAQPSGNWTYQTLSHLALTPSFGDTYTCVVEHIGAVLPILEDWTPGLSPIQKVKVSVSAVTLGLGLIIFFLGLISWWRSRFFSYTPVPGSNYPEALHIS